MYFVFRVLKVMRKKICTYVYKMQQRSECPIKRKKCNVKRKKNREKFKNEGKKNGCNQEMLKKNVKRW